MLSDNDLYRRNHRAHAHAGDCIRVAVTVAVFVLRLRREARLAVGGRLADWSAFELPSKDFRGPGYYLNWVKILAWWLLFLAWVKTTDWASTDCQDLKLDFIRWNPILFGSFLGAIVLSWILPIVLDQFSAAGDRLRRAADDVHHLSQLPGGQQPAGDHAGTPPLLVRDRDEKVASRSRPRSPIRTSRPAGQGLRPRAAPTNATNSARLLLARQSPGLTAAREILAEAFKSRATAIMLDYTQQDVAMRTMVDGVWIPREARIRETADPGAGIAEIAVRS